MLTGEPIRPPQFVLMWPRKVRAFVAAALFILTIILIPVLVMVTGNLIGFERCQLKPTPGESGICSNEGRWLLTVGFTLLLSVPFVLWVRLLKGIASFKE